ncbi:hypothetical protein SUGI_0579860 [Cryptomeria japonica]|uniref:protein CURVATURE THYLAKOID 1C, chloroplastic isoform X1 n=1 Tax=Cryptomeria japonica TaxID=3369 RepID=UPI002414C097|nr:protein CURVATURE THYLAKOID 1C, chloroplastic isoform X1 [Cryptomeria japonica]GLJ29412.1 hypothetical protein SUGI_0579860 [Cryptomeria japonica]
MACTSPCIMSTLAVQKPGIARMATSSSPHLVSLPAFKSHCNQSHLSSPFRSHPGGRRGRVIAMATTDPMKPDTDAIKPIQEAWEKTDDKLAIGGLGFAAIVVLWASTGLIGAVDRLPLIPGAFEIIGILFSGWFVYRYLLFQPDREELAKIIKDSLSKVTGQ